MEKEVKKRTASDIVRYMVMVIALCVFCYSGYRLVMIDMEYKAGTDEYSALEEKYILKDTVSTESAGAEDKEPTMKNPIDFDGLTTVIRTITPIFSLCCKNIM